jgi:DNA-binding response OmpR family regulator
MRVLIAEDEPLEAEALQRRLQALGHTVVDAVYDGAQAVTKAEALCPDLVFLDMRMPKLDGIGAAARILAHRRVPIILLTGQTDPALTATALRVGILGCLVKPVDRRELEATITLVMSRFTSEGPEDSRASGS